MNKNLGRKILLTSESGAFGGVEKRFIHEARVLNQMGWNVSAALPKFPKYEFWKELMLKENTRIIDWNPYKFLEREHYNFPFTHLAKFQRKRISRLNFDLAHVALPWTTVGMSRIYELKKLKIPTIISIRSKYPVKKFTRKNTRHGISVALTGVISGYAVSEPAKQSFLDNFGEYCNFEIDVIHNGVDCSIYNPSAIAREKIRKKLGVSSDIFLMAVCGRIDLVKRIDFILDIFLSQKIQERNIALVFIGDGPYKLDIEKRLTKENSKEKIFFSGFQSNVNEWLASCDLYLTASLNEGFPSSPAEALATGVPVLAPNDDVFQSCFLKGPYIKLLDPFNKNIWIDEIIKYFELDVESKNTVKTAARLYAEQNLDLSGLDCRLNKFYNKMSDLINVSNNI